MARFVKGDWVEVCPHPDYRWDSWTEENSNMCGKKGRITDIKKAEWVDETYIEVEYRGVRVWFKDYHLIKVDNWILEQIRKRDDTQFRYVGILFGSQERVMRIWTK